MATRYVFTIGDGTKLTPTEKRRLVDAIGPLQPGDAGKRVYKVSDAYGEWFYQVENNEQRDKRLEKAETTD